MKKILVILVVCALALLATDWPKMRILSAGNDGEWTEGFWTDYTHNNLFFGYLNTAHNTGLLLFPTGGSGLSGTVTSATLGYRVFWENGLSGAPHFHIHVVKAASPTMPTTNAEAAALTLTTAYVDWSPSGLSADTHYDAPDISSPIQELLTAYPNPTAILVVIKDQSDTASDRWLRIGSYEFWNDETPDPGTVPELDISYTAGGSPAKARMISVE